MPVDDGVAVALVDGRVAEEVPREDAIVEDAEGREERRRDERRDQGDAAALLRERAGAVDRFRRARRLTYFPLP
jgi:hypothetical protein